MSSVMLTGIDPSLLIDDEDEAENMALVPASGEVAPETEDDDTERDELLEKLKACYPRSVVEKEIVRLANLPIDKLRIIVETTIASTGGSFDTAKLIQEVEETYARITQSEVFQRKLAVVESRGSNYIATVQRIERLAGTDIVTQHLKFEEFMGLVKALIRNVEAVHSTILAIAEEENMWLPPENVFKKDDAIPLIPGIPADPRVIGFVLSALHSNLKGYHGQAVAANDINRKLLIQIEGLKSDLARSRQELLSANESRKGLVSFRPTCRDSLFCLRVGGEKSGRFLSLIHPDKKPSFENFNYEGTFEDALTVDSMEKARRYIDIFMRKKPKLLKKKGGLDVIEINFMAVE